MDGALSEKMIQQYTWNGTKKSMCYVSLVNGMRFILTAPTSELAAQAGNMQRLIFIGAVVAMLMAAVVGYIISISQTKPIRQIDAIVGETAKFNFTHYKSSESGGSWERFCRGCRRNWSSCRPDLEYSWRH